MYESLTIQSHRGPYTVIFEEDAFRSLDATVPSHAHFIVDERVAGLYAKELARVLAAPSVLSIEATEANKSLDKFTGYVDHLVCNHVRRRDTLIAVGGGIIQDITCFLAATVLRGLNWHFYPTTLLAQADSCIGSKSSINVGNTKNVLGTFTPPERIVISSGVLDTLDKRDLRSGIGEMLKVHAIEGPEYFDQIAADYHSLLSDRTMMVHYIHRSLEIKKAIIEQDEFDRGLRNIMNYGHSFGHAIESATDFTVPHGIAVTIGMDMANYTAVRLGLLDRGHYDRMHPTLMMNFAGFERLEVPLTSFFAALSKDKKNIDTRLGLILPDASARLTLGSYRNDAALRAIFVEYLSTERSR
ncbi:MAG: 3-dehydroquinate synthase [Gemmatimonadetes bacterium]|nr:3-dehydroquinate synthase [Gemmatimonadota bacterium]